MLTSSRLIRMTSTVLVVILLTCTQSAFCQPEVAPTSPQHRDKAATASLSGHSPDVALRWSILPGAGQVYNHQAWKIPIIYGAFAVAGYFIYDYHNSMVTFRDEYLYRINEGSARLQGYERYPNSSIYSLYQVYNRYFQLAIIVTVGIYALNLIDAYVFGHLFDFQLDESLALHFGPTLFPTERGLVPAIGAGFSF